MQALPTLLGLLLVSCAVGDPCNVAWGVAVGTVHDGRLAEMSGLAASRKNPGVLWTMQDSYAPNDVYAVSESGSVLLSLELEGIHQRDWEDIAIYVENGRHYLYVADTGNNIDSMNREVLSVYKFEEPSVGAYMKAGGRLTIPKMNIETFTFNYGPGFSYPNYPDCEALAIDPKNGDMYFFTKHNAHTTTEVYTYPASQQRPNSNHQLEYLGHMDILQVTGADITPEGHKLGISNYGGHGYGVERPSGTPWRDYFRTNPRPCSFDVAPEDQRESLAATDAGYFTTSEGKDKKIWFYAFN